MRTAVVTGANKGIGFQIAKQLLPSVSLLILACHDRSRGEAAAKLLGSSKCVVEELDLANEKSIDAFAERMHEKYDHLEVLVNNAAIAFPGRDPTPFEQQTGPTLKINYFGTVRLTEKLMPLLTKADDAQLVFLASMAGSLSQLSDKRQKQFSDPTLTKQKLTELVKEFETDVAEGRHKDRGWSNSNYGFSKLSIIAYTKILARDAPKSLAVNCCCPGYCDTDMTSHKGTRDPADGAKNAIMLAQPNCPHRGVFIKNEQVSEW